MRAGSTFWSEATVEGVKVPVARKMAIDLALSLLPLLFLLLFGN